MSMRVRAAVLFALAAVAAAGTGVILSWHEDNRSADPIRWRPGSGPTCRKALGEEDCAWIGADDPDGRRNLVISSRFDATFHCGAWPELLLIDQGADDTGNRRFRRYVRGSLGGTTGPFRTLDALPAAARDSGYRLGDRELWLPTTGDTEAYVVEAGRVELWPATDAGGCA